jgi:hypothetical protein
MVGESKMTAHELMCLEKGDQVRIRGSRDIFTVHERAEVQSRTESGNKPSVIKIVPFGMHPSRASEIEGFKVVPPSLKGRPHKHPVSLKRGRMD